MQTHCGNKSGGRKITRFLLAAVLCGCFVALAQLPTPQSDKKSSEVYKNVQVLKDVPSFQCGATVTGRRRRPAPGR